MEEEKEEDLDTDVSEEDIDPTSEDEGEDQGSLSPEERKELADLRQKNELKRSIDLLDEEYQRKGKRNLKIKTKEDDDTGDKDPEETVEEKAEKIAQEKIMAKSKEEQEDALHDFLNKNKEFYTPDKRKALLAEVNNYRNCETAGYREYTQMLEKGQKIIGVAKKDKGVDSFNEKMASGGGRGKTEEAFSDEIALTREQKEVARKLGITEKRYKEQLIKDRKK